MDEAVDVQLDPGRDEEEGHEDTEAGGLELVVEERVCHALVAIDQLQRGTCQERAEDGLQPELRGQEDEDREQQECTADADLGGCVLQAQQRLGHLHGALQTENRETCSDDEDEEGDQQRQLRPEPARLTREEEGEQDDRPDLGDRGARDDDLAECGRGLAGVLEDRQDHAEPGRREDDRHQQRRLDEVARSQPEADHDRDPERDGIADQRETQQPASQPLEVDLKPGQQEQEGEPDRGEHGHRFVHLGPAQHLRSDRDPEQDLEHDRRQSQTAEGDC